ncbi:ABC transporter ATP-binding protein YtrE [Streptomyces sp. YIM 121038]|nr:ABC transporter ATP-binding protein YtrE [Streptomyces sp. YIM 121038]
MVAPPDNDVLWARALHVTLNGTPALTGVSLGVREGEILAVGGPRGSGKTTLLRCLSGQLPPQRGEVWFNSTPVHTMGPLVRERLRRDRFGWIDPEPSLVPELTGWENAALALLLRGAPHRTAKRAALEWLERLDVGDCARKRPHALTRAECQRVAVARALAAAPAVLFADEPTAPLHSTDRAHVLRTLTTAARSHGITVVLATHDAEVAALADRTVALLDGRHVHTLHLPGDEQAPATSANGAGAARGTVDGPGGSGGPSAPGGAGAPGGSATAGAAGAAGRPGAAAGGPGGSGRPGGSDTEGRAACSLSV